MLRLKEALKDCGIQQQELVKVTGFGKTQVSLTLSTGKLPVGEEKFRGGVSSLVEASTGLQGWLEKRGLNVDSLFEVVEEPDVNAQPAELDAALINFAGRVALGQSLNPRETLSLIRISRHLLCLPGIKNRSGKIDAQWNAILRETKEQLHV
ncbi:MAG: hypothetical protein WCY54_08405 [Syntrophales bacterium]